MMGAIEVCIAVGSILRRLILVFEMCCGDYAFFAYNRF